MKCIFVIPWVIFSVVFIASCGETRNRSKLRSDIESITWRAVLPGKDSFEIEDRPSLETSVGVDIGLHPNAAEIQKEIERATGKKVRLGFYSLRKSPNQMMLKVDLSNGQKLILFEDSVDPQVEKELGGSWLRGDKWFLVEAARRD